jgi:hypothetical protein
MMPELNGEAARQLKKDELRKQFKIDPTAFLRQLAAAHVPLGQPPAANTHLLTWAGGRPHDHSLFDGSIIESLLDYILELEEKIAEDIHGFREKSLKHITEKRELSGFDKAQ